MGWRDAPGLRQRTWECLTQLIHLKRCSAWNHLFLQQLILQHAFPLFSETFADIAIYNEMATLFTVATSNKLVLEQAFVPVNRLNATFCEKMSVWYVTHSNDWATGASKVCY